MNNEHVNNKCFIYITILTFYINITILVNNLVYYNNKRTMRHILSENGTSSFSPFAERPLVQKVGENIDLVAHLHIYLRKSRLGKTFSLASFKRFIFHW